MSSHRSVIQAVCSAFLAFFPSTLGAAIVHISSADTAGITISNGVITPIDAVPCSGNHLPIYCYADGYWISNQDSGLNGANLAEPVGVAFQLSELFSLPVASNGVFTFGGDDFATASLVSQSGGATLDLGTSSFFRPVTATIQQIPAGVWAVVITDYNSYGNAEGNFTGVMYDGTFSSTQSIVLTSAPEPSTWFLSAAALALLALTRLRAKTGLNSVRPAGD